ncbi:bifunctional phosphatase PAP2/diacylglycerol kinase family protein [Crossiella cryophila]|uniref:bifunctional phosphatase PAP2/diacylglycerol kinase family protein n=1 Tax=Crossiella cryophila TaxID=43355 RepID=UPI00161F9AB8|nr:phosphatase PAP2 family protein [Crossiella cryophila]
MFEWFRRVFEGVDETDRDLVRRSADLPRSAVDPTLKVITTTANHSLLWFGVAALLASRKGRTRRAAFRGVVAIAGASATANLIAKPLFPRRRPAAELVPAHRRIPDPPTSSSFPSGHAASAAAFATAVVMEAPIAAAVVIPLAATVAYSRVHTGVHWPSDVAAGAVLGASIGLATRHWWPLRREAPADTRHQRQAAALPEGEGLLVVVNPHSGDDSFDQSEEVARNWPKAAVIEPSKDQDLLEQLRTALDTAEEPIRALGVAGGDGTVAAVASIAAERRLPLAVLPAGTLNHFARDVGAEEADSVVRAVDNGAAVAVDLSSVLVDGLPRRWFVNTASLGGYPDMVRLREKWEGRWGKWPAAAAALVRVLHASRPLKVRIDGETRQVWLLFVGNGSYEPKGFAPTSRPRLDDGLLDVRYVRADMRWSRTRFVLAALTGALHRSRTYCQQDRPEVEVEVLGNKVAIATDGEVGPDGRHFRFTSHVAALGVYRESEGVAP